MFSQNKLTYDTFNHLYQSQSQNLAFPQSLPELSNIIKNFPKIRVSGSNHTFNDMSLTPGLTLRTDRLNRILEINPQHIVLGLSPNTCRVESGALIDDINVALAQHGLALPVEAATSLPSAGGVISTGTHGSNISAGSFCNAVQSMTLVLENGNVRTFDEQDGDYFRAVKCGLGCLGAIYDITFKCEPLYGVDEKIINTTWNDFISNLDNVLSSYPLTQATVKSNLETKVTLRKKIPWTTGAKHGYQILSSNQESRYYIESEMAIPIESLNSALIYTVQLHRKYGVQSDILVRFCNADDTLISMEAGRQTAFISNFFGHEVNPDVAIDILKIISNELVSRFNARPHYGKIHDLNINKMALLYGDSYHKFKRIKNELSPSGKFDNDYILRLFG